ncbi:MAG: AAA-like domain-containing protein [Lachnospiraceae bacterium]|nr:AAA-like domain-containing protein [Lachnospiraceae bacterium]MDE7274288.1 AAA-like domain-containing protein [Lachnospiraceae bacterium]
MQTPRYFNTEGCCSPHIHYMVPLDSRLETIRELYVKRGKYFVINRGRQYGKTTTLTALAEYLQDDYTVISMDFQLMSTASFADEQTFVVSFIRYLEELVWDEENLTALSENENYPRLTALCSQDKPSMDEMFRCFSRICRTATKPVVLIIDEVDSASNNQVFIDFLAQLRGYYLARSRRPIFQSVILAGVYDIRNLKLKIRRDAEHQYNSPWNIAADFDIKMNFSAEQIQMMLAAYESDHQTGMNIQSVADEIYQYTSGYPYLVSAICKILDEKPPFQESLADGGQVWTRDGVGEAVKILLKSKTTLFDSLIKHISEYPDMKQMLYKMLFTGEPVAYNQYNHTIEMACMFGYVVEEGINIHIANRIFETCLYNLFLSEEELSNALDKLAKQDKNQFLSNGRLDMERVLGKFVEHFHDIYGENNEKFVEDSGRKFFLLYLRPIINGTGNYYIEAQTRDARRTDIIVDYAGEQFVVEMKLWRGNEYNERGEQQLADYLDYYHQNKGYLLSFNFNKKKQIGMKTITIGDKTIVEAVV